MSDKGVNTPDEIKDFIAEGRALEYLKLKETAFHPTRSWKTYVRPTLLILMGLVWIGYFLSQVIYGEKSQWPFVLFGVYFTLLGAWLLHKRDIEQLHQRIDSILDLYFKDNDFTQKKKTEQTDGSKQE